LSPLGLNSSNWQRIWRRANGAGNERNPHVFLLEAGGNLRIAVDPLPLAEVEAAWKRVEKRRGIVFTP
jgi:hypothetical protein